MAFSRKVAAGAALLLVYSLLPGVIAPPRRGAERGVRLALIRLNELLSRRDMAIVGEYEASEVQFAGSEASQRAHGREELEAFFKRLFAMPKTLAFSWREVDVQVRGPVAWLYAEGDVVLRADDGTEERKPYRLSGVLELTHGEWRWRLFHGSQPA